MRPASSARRPLFAVVVCLLTVILPLTAEGRMRPGKGWHFIETRHTLICYRATEDLRRFDRSVRAPGGKRGFWILGKKRQDLAFSVTKKVDAIFEKVQRILGMGRRMERVSIYLYPDREALEEVHYKIYNEETHARAWYIFEWNAAFMNVRDLHEGVVAHELAHAVIDHHFKGPPPRETAEILARYVDGHLFREVRPGAVK